MIFKEWTKSQDYIEGANLPNRVYTEILPSEYVGTIDKNVYIVSNIGSNDYAFLNGNYVNLNSLKEAISRIYSENGYNGVGFSKLSSVDLGRYVVVARYLKELLQTSMTMELDVEDVAKYLLTKECVYFVR